MVGKKFLFTTERALYPPFLKVIEILAEKYKYDCTVLVPEEFNDSPVWQHINNIQNEIENGRYNNIKFIRLPVEKKNVVKYGFLKRELTNALDKIEPDYIFILSEFWEGLTYQFLKHYRFTSEPKIISYAAINHISGNPIFIKKFPFIRRTRLKQVLTWGRLDGVTACATKSAECARLLGLPVKVPIKVNYLPVFGPGDLEIEKYSLPWNEENNFIIGYAGLLSEQKGWRYLVEAVLSLPDNYKLIIAGEGPQKNELLEYVKTNKSRIHYAGLLSKERLFGLYMQLDLLVLPSVTTSYLAEQMGAVLAEAMSCKVPVAGSSSGAIPEIIGNAGLIFEEKNVDDLVDKIKLIFKDEKLREKVIAEGLKKYEENYSCKSYAASLYNLFENNKM